MLQQGFLCGDVGPVQEQFYPEGAVSCGEKPVLEQKPVEKGAAERYCCMLALTPVPLHCPGRGAGNEGVKESLG